MALPIPYRFTYPIMMLLLTEESIRLVWLTLSMFLTLPAPTHVLARVMAA
jgi:hypothetical protein